MMVMMCRITCLPGDVELNKRTITIQRSVPRGFIENLARTMSNRLNIYVELQAMPTMEEIAKRITEIREQRKVETIRRHEANPELQKIIKQARLQGIKISMDDIIPEGEAAVLDRPSQNTEDEIADLEGALDFQMDTENPDENDPDSFNDY
jgi:predicted peroxiredoxin